MIVIDNFISFLFSCIWYVLNNFLHLLWLTYFPSAFWTSIPLLLVHIWSPFIYLLIFEVLLYICLYLKSFYIFVYIWSGSFLQSIGCDRPINYTKEKLKDVLRAEYKVRRDFWPFHFKRSYSCEIKKIRYVYWPLREFVVSYIGKSSIADIQETWRKHVGGKS